MKVIKESKKYKLYDGYPSDNFIALVNRETGAIEASFNKELSEELAIQYANGMINHLIENGN